MGSASTQSTRTSGDLAAGRPTGGKPALGRYLRQVRRRMALGWLLWAGLGALAVAVVLVLGWLALGSPLSGSGGLLVTLLTAGSGGLLLVGLSGWLVTRLGRSSRPVVSRVAQQNRSAAEGLRSALELARSTSPEAGIERAFAECHAHAVARRLGTLPPVEVVPLTWLGRAGWLLTGLAAITALSVALVPGAPGRLAANLGLSSGNDRLPVVLRGSGVRDVRMVIHPPRYTGLPLDAVVVGDAPVTVPAGSRVTVVARVPVALSAARGLLADGRVVPGVLLGERVFRVELVAGSDGSVVFAYRSRAGVWYVGEVGPSYRVRPDLPPDVRVRPSEPKIVLERPEVLPLRWEVTDDYGVVETRLRWRTDLGDEGALVLGRGPRFGKQRKQRLRGVLKWDLTKLRLGVGQRVSFHVEVRDNRSDADRADGNRVQSPEQSVVIRGKKPPGSKILARLRALLERAVSLLADRLVDPSITDCATRLKRLKRRGPGQARLIERLDAILGQARGQELPALLKAALTRRVAGHRRSLGAVHKKEQRALAHKRPTGCQKVAGLKPLQGKLVVAYEDLVLELDSLVGRATLERMQQLAKRIEKLQREIQKLEQQNRKHPSKELKRRIAKRLAQLRQLFQKLGGLWSTLQDEAIDQHVNRYALDRKKTDRLLRRLSAQSRGGKTSSADMKELKRRVDRLKRALDRGLDSFRRFYRVPGERALRKSARGVRQLARDQAALNEQLGKRPGMGKAGEQSRLGQRADRLARALGDKPGTSAAAKLLDSAAQMMKRAAEAMKKGKSGHGERKAARDALDGAARELDRQGRLQPNAGRDGDRDGDRDRGRGKVDIPPAGGALPRELRKVILQGGRAAWPERFRGPLKRYYERLLR